MILRPWKIALKFHPPIETTGERAAAIRDQRAAAINGALEPAIRAEEKVDALVVQPAPHIRIYEWFLCVVLLALRAWPATLVAGIYFVYLLADVFVIRQSRRTRALRNFAPVLALAGAYPSLAGILGPPATGPWLVAYVVSGAYALWAAVNYCFRRYLQFQRFVRGLLLTLYATVLTVAAMPAQHRQRVVVSLALFVLLFDLGQARRRCYATIVPVAGTCLGAAILAGYGAVDALVNVLTVAGVFGYMRVFKMRAHDGRCV